MFFVDFAHKKHPTPHFVEEAPQIILIIKGKYDYWISSDNYQNALARKDDCNDWHLNVCLFHLYRNLKPV